MRDAFGSHIEIKPDGDTLSVHVSGVKVAEVIQTEGRAYLREENGLLMLSVEFIVCRGNDG